MKHEEIDVIIPVYRPDEKLHRLLLALERQTVKPSRILLVNTERELFDDACVTGTEHVEVIHIRKSEFDHGGTRHMAAEMLQGAFLLFLTQDAIPADDCLIERLYEAFATGRESDRQQPVAAAYARQLPMPDCHVIERYTRSFNYGKESRIKTADDLETLGIKTFFCSNVCASVSVSLSIIPIFSITSASFSSLLLRYKISFSPYAKYISHLRAFCCTFFPHRHPTNLQTAYCFPYFHSQINLLFSAQA